VVSLTGLLARPAPAQLPRLTLGAAVQGVGSDPVFGGIGPTFSARLTGQVRLRTLVLMGRRGDRAAVRGEGVLELVLDPGAEWSPFAGGGVAAAADRGDLAGFIVATIGIERRPAGRWSWWAETGLGGGVRLAAGYRFAMGDRPRRPR
jgi:hypothetical protein